MHKIGLFLGTERGHEVLSKLLKNKRSISGVLVLSQEKHEFSNYTKKIEDLCKKNKINYKTTAQIKPDNYSWFLSKTKPDVLFVVSWRYLIPRECFGIPKFGIFVLHDSILPKYRGFSPTNWVIINGEKQTGLTLQAISENMDAGDIIDQVNIPITADENAKTLNDKFLKLYPKIIIKNIDLILNNKNKRIPQQNHLATYGCKRIPEDGKIDFNNPSVEILRLIRGLTYPYPGAFCFYKKAKVTIWDAQIPRNYPRFAGRIPGKIIQKKEGFVDVLTGDGVLRITSVGTQKNNYEPVKPNMILNSISHTLV